MRDDPTRSGPARDRPRSGAYAPAGALLLAWLTSVAACSDRSRPTEPAPPEPEPPFSAALTLLGDDPANNSWVAEEGTVTITRSSPGEIEGTFEFRATRWFPANGQPRPITARGAFHSTCTPGQQCP